MKRKLLISGVIFFSALISGLCQSYSIYEKEEPNKPQFYIIATTGIAVLLAGYSLYDKRITIFQRRIINIVALTILVIVILYQMYILREPDLYTDQFILLFIRNAAFSFWCYDYASGLKLSPRGYSLLGFFFPGFAMFLLFIKKHRNI
jgi:hypothetical protein